MNERLKYYAIRAMQVGRLAQRHALYRMHGILHDTVTLRTKQGLLTMSTRDDGVGGPLYRQKHYEYDASIRAIQFLKRSGFLPATNVTMLDVGANIGVISIGLLLAKEVERAVAIEPEPKNFELLMTNVKQNGVSDKVICLQMAVGETASTLTMELSLDNPGDHRVRSTPIKDSVERYNESSRRTIYVQSLPLRQILELPEIRDSAAATPSMVWIDVQGYEGYIFAGAKDFLSSGIPTVSEVWPYGIRRAGMSLDRFNSVVADIWTDYWIERRGRLIRYPMTVFDRYLDELGEDDYSENVIFTKGNALTPQSGPSSN